MPYNMCQLMLVILYPMVIVNHTEISYEPNL